MRCARCDYSLWGLRARSCPECGHHFLPSQFRFVPGAVRYLCPHCSQAYYGTGANGHLAPARFTCVSCARPVSMDEMILEPAQGVRDESTLQLPMPWRDRRRLGIVRAWWRTTTRSFVAPGSLMRADPGPSASPASTFLALNIGVALVPSLAAFFLLMIFTAGTGPSVFVGVMFVGSFLLMHVGALVWTILSHFTLMLTGGTAGPMKWTWQAICYASSPVLFLAIPCLSIYVLLPALAWWTVGASIMVCVRQRVSWWRSALAIAMPPVIILIALGALLVMPAVLTMRSTLATMSASPGIADTQGAQAMGQALLESARRRGGAWPGHAIVLLADGDRGRFDFASVFSVRTPLDIPVGGMTLDRAADLSDETRHALADELAGALPPGTIAHRLGDYVFTYHGVDAAASDPRIWIVLSLPPRVVTFPGEYSVAACRLDGTVDQFPRSQLDLMTARQNELREEAGLSPLPVPLVVGENPVVADPD